MEHFCEMWLWIESSECVLKVGIGIGWAYSYVLEKAMAPHSSTLAWQIPWMEEPGGLQSMGSLRVRHDWATSLSLLCIGEGNGNPLQCSCLENPRDGGAWWAAVYGVTQSRTQPKWLSSSNSIHMSTMRRQWQQIQVLTLYGTRVLHGMTFSREGGDSRCRWQED